MISDEMRELLSAYVDGELRDTDAARVEDMSKRDKELRREIEAMRKLGHKLRDWDEAEHGHAPPATLAQRALARARKFVAERDRSRRGRVVGRITSPWAVAAGLLLAVGAGIVFAGFGETATPPEVAAAVTDIAEYPDLGVDAYTPKDIDVAQPPALTLKPAFTEVMKRRAEGYALYQDKISEKTLAFLQEQEALERKWDAIRNARRSERRTGTRHDLTAMSIVGPYEAVAAPVAGMVLLEHQASHVGLPPVRGLAGKVGIREHSKKEHGNSVIVKTEGAYSHVVLLGEVFATSERARLVTAATWIESRLVGDFVPVAWADNLTSTRDGLSAAGFVAGPQLRRRLLKAKGLDTDLLGWLAGTYKGGFLEAARATVKRHRRDVDRLVAMLRDRTDATGFAVVSDGKVLGVEMFATHELALDLAPRLLYGYLLEAGPKGIQLKPTSEDLPLLERAQEVIRSLPKRTMRTRDLKTWGDLRAVNLTDGARNVIAHGVLKGTRPIHITVFADR